MKLLIGMMSTRQKPDLIGVFRECSLHDDKSFKMIIVTVGASIFDCYVQRVFIQMGLLKLIEVNKVVNV